MKIVFGGDVSVMEDCRALFEAGDHEALFGDVPELFRGADRVMVNLECALTESNTPIKKIGPNLKAPPATADVLRKIGVTDCALANNHIFDFGIPGARDTLAQLARCGIGITGFGTNDEDARRDYILTDGKVRIAVIAVCEHEYSYALPHRMGARAYDPYDTADDVMKAKESADCVVVLYHGGKEDCPYPSPRLRKLCRSLIKHGADVVLCQHSHCIGCYEEFMDGHILYGQGNFHFVCKDYEDPADGGTMWNTGLLAVLDVEDTVKLTFVPHLVDGAGIRLARPKEAEQILEALAERSRSLSDGSWQEKWRAFALAQHRYRVFPAELYEEIAHYFDCEAHTDVCKEIYQTYNLTNETEEG